jgi:rhamnogalacturonan endolyase
VALIVSLKGVVVYRLMMCVCWGCVVWAPQPLYATAPGVVGEYRQDNMTVDSTGEIQLGTLDWAPRTFGEALWRIGVPDRSAAEFRRGNEFREWGVWFNYPKDFPNEVDFTIGKSREERDWNYAHMVYWSEEGGWRPKLDVKTTPSEGAWCYPTWKVRFNCDQPMRGRARLTFAMAGVDRDGGIVVGLNGATLKTITGMHVDSSVARNGIAGMFREYFVDFDAATLKRGENVLTLGFAKKTSNIPRNYPPMSMMYDFVQLEVNE